MPVPEKDARQQRQEHAEQQAQAPVASGHPEEKITTDNEPKANMPVYPGLEGFKLVEKMGEYVTYML